MMPVLNMKFGPLAATCALILAAQACNLPAVGPVDGDRPTAGPTVTLEEETAPREAATTFPTDDAEETASPSTEPTAAQPAIDAPATLDLDLLDETLFPTEVETYRITIDRSFDGDGDSSGRITGEGAVDVDRAASTLTERIEGNALQATDEGATEHRSIDGMNASLQEGGICNIFNYNIGLLQQMLDPTTASLRMSLIPERFLTGEAELAEAGVEVNGRLTNRYSLTADNITGGDPPTMEWETLETGDVFVDSEMGTLVRLVIKGVGRDSVINWESPDLVGEIRYEINFLDFDVQIEIEPLPGCSLPLDTGFPILETVLLLTTDLNDVWIDYHAQASVEDAADFYRTEMQAAGWTLVGEESFSEEDVFLNFQNASGEGVLIDLTQAPMPPGADPVTLISILPMP